MRITNVIKYQGWGTCIKEQENNINIHTQTMENTSKDVGVNVAYFHPWLPL